MGASVGPGEGGAEPGELGAPEGARALRAGKAGTRCDTYWLRPGYDDLVALQVRFLERHELRKGASEWLSEVELPPPPGVLSRSVGNRLSIRPMKPQPPILGRFTCADESSSLSSCPGYCLKEPSLSLWGAQLRAQPHRANVSVGLKQDQHVASRLGWRPSACVTRLSESQSLRCACFIEIVRALSAGDDGPASASARRGKGNAAAFGLGRTAIGGSRWEETFGASQPSVSWSGFLWGAEHAGR